MSDQLAETINSNDGNDAVNEPISDVNGASSIPEVVSLDANIFEDNNFDKEFGLPPEEKEADVSTQEEDVTPAPDPPVARPDEPVKTEGEAKVEEPVAKPDEETDGQFKPNEKLNWEDDKLPFREEFKNLKDAYLTLVQSSVETQFITDPTAHANWMKETSPDSYRQLGSVLATESAETHPKEWIEYFAEKNPDLLAEVISGREGMTAERLKAELSLLTDDDDEDVQAAMAKQPQPEVNPEETPEQRRVREILERDERQESQAAIAEVFSPIEESVSALVSQAGLEIDRSAYEGKDFFSLDKDTQLKIAVNDILIPNAIEFVISRDPKLMHMQSRLESLLSTKDEKGNRKQPDRKGAMALQHHANILATNVAGVMLELITGKVAATKKAETITPTKDTPPPQVRTAGASNGSLPPTSGEIDWSGAM